MQHRVKTNVLSGHWLVQLVNGKQADACSSPRIDFLPYICLKEAAGADSGMLPDLKSMLLFELSQNKL